MKQRYGKWMQLCRWKSQTGWVGRTPRAVKEIGDILNDSVVGECTARYMIQRWGINNDRVTRREYVSAINIAAQAVLDAQSKKWSICRFLRSGFYNNKGE